ncbi:primosome, DnaD subunit [Desulfofarcimen acetoxidans DSM 771]|uniref:Primosome, DnaD subunit n=1 Tax=Desulfofarcimen acetoxidans (strain ATCC 49208 / DSM 771 / KCTC 5769 / VKM B-1644 / 5575) TaxID=485916 RepID=C8W681_DESAS|nr:DnaD domain protein [Desulfofarcimen acetoxidans]ACV62170.1 primosome, DnaD subunit [Desulfofarcimen acetoxidans DSM 771]
MNLDRKALKKYRAGNVTSAFGTDLMMQGFTSIPNILLKHYKAMGISDIEMLLLVQLLRIHSEEKDFFPTTETLANCMQSDISLIEDVLASLIEKDILAITKYYDEFHDMIISGYDFEPLFESVSEIWACAKVKELEKTQKMLEEQEQQSVKNNFPEPNHELAQLYKTFENEFARPLSPMEIEQIQKWVAEMNSQLIREALKRAVLLGKHNFKYIDSIIMEWQKNNLRTLEAINNYDINFQRRRNTKVYSGNASKTQSSDAKKKAMIESLYMS